MKPVIIQSDLSDEEILALADEFWDNTTIGKQVAVMRRVLPQLLEGWAADDVDEMTFGEYNSLPNLLTCAIEQHKIRRIPLLTSPLTSSSVSRLLPPTRL